VIAASGGAGVEAAELAEVVRSTQDAVFSKDLTGHLRSWNPAAERLYGYSAAEAVGRHISFIIPVDRRHEEEDILARIRRHERLETYETERIRKDGARVDVSLTISPLQNQVAGELIGASVVARDVTAERRRRRAQDFLLGTSRILDASLDPAETARAIVGCAVPELAELCVIDFVLDDGRLGESTVAGADPEVAARLEEIRRSSPLDPAGEHPVARVIREGRPAIWQDLDASDLLPQIVQSDEHKRLIEDVGFGSAAVVALVARGRTLGAISFLHTRKDLRYDPADLDLLVELGERAAMALDNARLFHERDRIASILQDGLRPTHPAEVPGLQISVVFEPAGDKAEIGGDVYDVLPTEDGCWILIADVTGRGSGAVGASVLVRNAVKGLTREIDDPMTILQRVNELLLEGGGLNDLATAVLIRMRASAGGWVASFAGAGHPPVIHISGAAVTQIGGGSLLGAWADVVLARHEARIEPGDTLLLYTDGWLEVGSSGDHLEPQSLADLAPALSLLGLEEMTDGLRVDALSRGHGTLPDDLVIFAVRAVPGRPDAGSDDPDTLLEVV
jgi:PAS domain S-box-containing protein